MKTILKALQRLPGWPYLPGPVKSAVLGAGNPPLYPTHIQVEPTRRCNLRCVMCPGTYSGRDLKPDMTLDFFKKILVQVPSVTRLSLNGNGEPFMNPDLIGMIEFARSRGLYTRFNTNFTRLNDETIERLVASGHSEVTISIEAIDPDTYADIRRGASLETVMANLRKLVETKARYNSDTPKLIVYALLMKFMLPHIEQFVETFRQLGVPQLTFTDVNTDGINLNVSLRDGSRLGDNMLLSTMSEDEIWQTLRDIKRLEDDTLEIVVPGDYGGLKRGRKQGVGVLTCDELWEMPFVTCDGYVTPCCFASHPSVFNMGNLRERSFDEIWFGPAYRRLRRQHLTNRHPRYCAQCQQLVYTVAEPSRFFGPCDAKRRHTRGFLFKSTRRSRNGD